MGRSFFTVPKPNATVKLGDYADLWTGLFSSAVLGNIPYVNVDVSHKAFPSAMNLVQIVDEMYSVNRFARGNVNSQIDRGIAEQLEKHLRGLRIIYEVPGNKASKKSYKFLKLGQTVDRESFSIDGKSTTVANYFAHTKNVKLRYPNLPCIKCGSTIKEVVLPLEFCSVAPGQVRKSFIISPFIYNFL